MVPPRNQKPRRNLLRRQNPAVWSLPSELLVDVLARVASSSITDLFNARLSCRNFLSLAEEDYVFQNTSIENYPWGRFKSQSIHAIEFINRCINVGNPDMLFKKGAIEYLGSKRINLGLNYLRRAAEKHDTKSMYLYGMILLSIGGDSTRDGLNILNSMRSKNWDNIRDCRAKVKEVLGMIWDAKIHVPKREVTCFCDKTKCWRVEYYVEKQKTCVDCRWSGQDLCSRHNADFWSVETCDDCRWSTELGRFYDLVSHD